MARIQALFPVALLALAACGKYPTTEAGPADDMVENAMDTDAGSMSPPTQSPPTKSDAVPQNSSF